MSDGVSVSINLFAALKRYMPKGSEKKLTFELESGATVQDVVDLLEISREHAGLLVIDNKYVEADTVLEDGIELSIFPPLAGGICIAT